MFTAAFWRAATERAVSTVAQAAGALLLAEGTGLLDTDWTTAASVSGMAGLLSLLKSIAVGAKDGNPSATNAETLEG